MDTNPLRLGAGGATFNEGAARDAMKIGVPFTKIEDSLVQFLIYILDMDNALRPSTPEEASDEPEDSE